MPVYYSETQRLSWTQRIALVRYNFHAALRTNDFTFFRTLQAKYFLEGTDHVAILTSLLGGEVDTVLHTLDDLNISLAYAHEDAFKNVYDYILSSAAEEERSRRSKIRLNIGQQKATADTGIDKTAAAAIALIENQDSVLQEALANVWLFGTTIVTDAMQTVVLQMDNLEAMMDDLVLLENAWHVVQTSIEATVSALRGVFNLMASAENEPNFARDRDSYCRTLSGVGQRSRATSVGSTASNLFKRLSTVLSSNPYPSSTCVYKNAKDQTAAPKRAGRVAETSVPAITLSDEGDVHLETRTDHSTSFETPLSSFDIEFQSLHETSSCSNSLVETATESSMSPLDFDPLDDNAGLSITEPKNHTKDSGP
ncbi:uncharacterized protein PV09_00013 [Verruconis gallopava]|uniref:Uncharacterized protein n=1 Tax=Verruconis gallopava TaxID=253628 RepID=A0A0D2BCH7_9PEZI|nr:uncharacterized protein PV09_00013 [Verruconis gallopava]KIW09064.1 hypothetical protein PV09_00013 [Verruconis gallopava]